MNAEPSVRLLDVIDRDVTFPAPVLEAVKGWARAKPWQGSFEERFEKLTRATGGIYEGFDQQPWQPVHVGKTEGDSTRSRLQPRLRRLQLTGRLSVITTLLLVGITLKEQNPFRWAITLFAKGFPRSAGRCVYSGGRFVTTFATGEGRQP